MCLADDAGTTEGASLLVLPEALLARDDNDPDLSVKSAQPLDGAFYSNYWPRVRVMT